MCTIRTKTKRFGGCCALLSEVACVCVRVCVPGCVGRWLYVAVCMMWVLWVLWVLWVC